MGRALVGGLLQRGVTAEEVRIGEPSEARRTALAQEFGIFVSPDNTAVIAQADLIVLAVKPQDARAVLSPLEPRLRERRPLVISIMAGIRIEALQKWCGSGVPIVRAMPNRPALVGAGATGLFAPAHLPAAQRDLAEHTMRSVGEAVWVHSEDALDVVTALSGSGPAYFFLLADLMTQAAIDLGLQPQTARTLAVETLYGAGLMAHMSDGDLGRLRAEVTSKGGTTEAAVRVFDEAQLRSIVARALGMAARRGHELSEQFGAKD